jgi:hypothetical protein
LQVLRGFRFEGKRNCGFQNGRICDTGKPTHDRNIATGCDLVNPVDIEFLQSAWLENVGKIT